MAPKSKCKFPPSPDWIPLLLPTTKRYASYTANILPRYFLHAPYCNLNTQRVSGVMAIHHTAPIVATYSISKSPS